MDRHACTVYVANLPWLTTEDQLAALFQEVAPVAGVRIVQDSVTGRSRGYGFVEFTSPEAAERAIRELSGREFGGRKLTVGPAHPRDNRRR